MEDDESLMDTVKTLFYAIVIAILIRTFLFEPFKIPRSEERRVGKEYSLQCRSRWWADD